MVGEAWHPPRRGRESGGRGLNGDKRPEAEAGLRGSRGAESGRWGRWGGRAWVGEGTGPPEP